MIIILEDIVCKNDSSCLVSFHEPNVCPICSYSIQPILLGNRLHYFDIGYRKALEFLIKDFLINYEKKDEKKVKPTPLGTCINTMIDNPQLKTVASRATWLGNDQTHYEQKYTDNDIDDLKRLIELSVHWISLICLTDEAELIEKK